ncbi:hypothetical protein OB955_04420 [Halobacteria archaeon AArc-m2/3/4]|uniref:Uncharacterized protein n=1 Tax=Natronoglomus mannanivorans TaxID=2979990 RepID=A0ABT2QAN5_9EURY|nr:hypothetical protein [Halobacteria archaeon AArc-m2/3/4]
MGDSFAKERFVSASTWFRLGSVTVETVIALALLASAASLFAVSIGDPEMVALIGAGAVTVIVLGLALARLFSYLEINGLPVIENGGELTRSRV